MKKCFRSFWSVVIVVTLVVGMMSGYTVKAVTTTCDTYSGTNIGSYNYSIWASPMESYLYAKSDGTFMRVQYGSDIDGLLVEYYDGDYNLTGHKIVSGEMPIFGGFYATDNYYYVVTGQENPEASDTVDVYRITKYDTDWNKVKSVNLSNCNTTVPFYAGSCRMDMSGNYLLIRTSHKMYSGHQSNLTMEVNVNTMTITDSFTEVMNYDYGYVSHSFNQFIKIDNNKIVSIDHGDTHPRSVALIKYPTDISTGKFQSNDCQVINVMRFAGEEGNNTTGTSVGGFEISDSKYLVAGNTVVQDNNFENAVTRNIFVAAVDKSTSEVATTLITGFSEGEETTTTPHMIKISSDKFMILWTRGETVYYTLIDGQGNQTGITYSMKGKLSDCMPVYVNGKVVWYTWLNNVITFYDINVNNLSDYNTTVITNGHDYNIVRTGDGTVDLKCSKCNNEITQKVITDMTIWWNMEGSYVHSTGLEQQQPLGQVINCSVTYSPADANNEMEFISSDESVVSVEMTDYDKAKLTMADVGTATITVRPKYNPVNSATYKVTVTGPFKVKSFTMDKGNTAAYGDIVNLSVDAAGGEGVLQYKFYEVNENGETTVLRDFGTKSSFQWIPKKVGKRTLYVDVKDGEGTVKTAKIENVVINKGEAPAISDINRSYSYVTGAYGESIDIDAFLPQDIVITNCKREITDTNNIISDASWSASGNFVYSVSSQGKVGDVAECTLVIESENYDDIFIHLNVSLTDIGSVKPKSGYEPKIQGSNVITYGEKLSSLTIDSNNAVFVTEDGAVVKGMIAFDNPELIPDAGTTKAAYTFTPDSYEYRAYSGTINILVEKATPMISDVEADSVNYVSGMKLSDISLKNGEATAKVAGNDMLISGTWKWKNGQESVYAGNSQHTLIFTPTETQNYYSVETDVDVNILKGICEITTLPEISELTYGQTLAEAQISGGVAQSSGNMIEGRFRWKDETVLPTVDNLVECILVFTPNDTDNYDSATAAVKVTVNKAEQAPNIPQPDINVKNGVTTLAEVELPEGWSWKNGDMELAEGQTLTATAVYKDSVNYSVWEVQVQIYRSLCDHQESDLIIDVQPNCQKEGTAHTECVLCGLELRSNIVVPITDHQYGEFLAKDIDSHYKECAVCGDIITEPHVWEVVKVEELEKETVTTYECSICSARKEIYVEKDNTGGNGGTNTSGGNTDKNDDKNHTNGGNNTSGNDQNAEVKVNTVIKAGSASYKVTKVGKSGQSEVELSKISAKAKSYVVPDFMVVNGVKYKITSIKAKAFYKHKYLKKITIGKYVKTIGKKAFYGCKKLKKITVKSSVLKKVGKQAIKGIYKKAVIKVPKKKYKKYKKLFGTKSGYKKTMKVKK